MIKKPSSYLIEATNLTYQYGEGDLVQRVLKGASLKVTPGEFVILAGPSGSGKSTLLSMIGALRSMQEGSLYIDGHDMKFADDNKMRLIRRQIGYVFQQHNLLSFLTARQNVQMTLDMFGDISGSERQKRAEEILEKVGMEKHFGRYPSQLSVGQKQRVAIARSLVHQPKIILADEPTASLDGKTGVKVVELLQEMIKNMGCGALVVTHDNRIFEYADRILHIEDGMIAE